MNERVELSIEYRYSMYYTKARGDIQIPVPVLVACFVVRANGARRFVVRVLAPSKATDLRVNKIYQKNKFRNPKKLARMSEQIPS